MLASIRPVWQEQLRQESFEVKEAILPGALEHLFAVPAIADHFRPWRQDPVLRPIYDEAITLAEGFSNLANTTPKPGSRGKKPPRSR